MMTGKLEFQGLVAKEHVTKARKGREGRVCPLPGNTESDSRPGEKQQDSRDHPGDM